MAATKSPNKHDKKLETLSLIACNSLLKTNEVKFYSLLTECTSGEGFVMNNNQYQCGACPAGQSPDASTHICSCPSGKVWNSATTACECDSGNVPNPDGSDSCVPGRKSLTTD